MLRIISSNTSNTAMDAVIDRIAVPSRDTERDVVIVPDAYTLTAERYVPERLGLQGSMTMQVVSFARLAYKELGNNVGKVLSKEGAVLILKKVISAHVSELVHYGKVAEAPGFAGEVYAVIASIRNNGITVERMEEALTALSGGTLTKSRDILLLYKEYLKAIEQYSDSTTRLEAFAKLIPESESLRKARYFIFGFDSLSAKQIDIIKALSSVAEVTIGLIDGADGANAEFYPTDVTSRLLYAFDRAEIPYQLSEVRTEVVKAPFSVLHRNMFSMSGGSVEDDENRVTVFAERNIYAEYNAVAHEISRLVRREGLRYKDIAVVDCNPEHSRERAEIFERYRIPYFADKRYPLSGTLPLKFVLSAVNAVRFGYRRDKVLFLVKNPLFGCDKTTTEEFENTVLKENINFNAFNEPFTDAMAEYEPVRQKLQAITGGFRTARTVGDYARHAERLLASDEVRSLLDEALVGVEENVAKSNLKGRERLIEVLEEYIALIGDEPETDSDFARTLEASATAEQIALIPRFADSVYVGTPREGFIVRQKAIFILNATIDRLPTAQSYKAIVSAVDSDRLEEAGMRLYPTPKDRIREECFSVIDLVTKTDKLYIGYPETEPSGAENKPSQAVNEIARLLNKEVISLEERFYLSSVDSDESLEDAVVTPENAFFAYLAYRGDRNNPWIKKLRASLREEERSVADDYLDKEPVTRVPMAEVLRRGDGYVTKVSELESYFRCPYAHYLQYCLRLKTRDDGSVQPRSVGDIVHECLEKYFGATMGTLRAKTLNELDEIRQNVVNEVFAHNVEVKRLQREAASAHIIAKLKEECLYATRKLTDNLLKGSFDVIGVELEFGKGSDIPPLIIDTDFGKVALRGKIDRVDKSGNYVVVVDYKTGVEDGHISELYYGKKLQLYIYLNAVSDYYKLTPVGALYIPIRSGYNTDKSLKFIGQFVYDIDVLDAFEKGLVGRVIVGSSSESEILPLKLKYDKTTGELKPTSDLNALDASAMSKALDYSERVASVALNEIAEGNIARSPLDDACRYCEYLGICGGAEIENIRVKSAAARPFGNTEEERDG